MCHAGHLGHGRGGGLVVFEHAVLTAVGINVVSRFSRVKEDAAVGIVFTAMFALGVILISWLPAGTHFDMKCFLFGDPLAVQRADLISIIVIVPIVLGTVIVFFRPLKLMSFDSVMASTMGFNTTALHYLLMILLAGTVVAALRSVGVVMAVAMLITPAGVVFGPDDAGVAAVAQGMFAARAEGGAVHEVAPAIEVVVEPFLPPPVLIIVGGVHIAVPLVRFAKELGFYVVVVDPRAKFANRDRFPEADEILLEWPDEALAHLDVDDATYLVLLKHHPRRPRALFQVAKIYKDHLEKPRKALLYYERFVRHRRGLSKRDPVHATIRMLRAQLRPRPRPRRARPRPRRRRPGGRQP